MSETSFTQSFDARVWAAEWCRIAKEIVAANDGHTPTFARTLPLSGARYRAGDLFHDGEQTEWISN